MSTNHYPNAEYGYRYAVLAYVAWGLFPLYWKLLKAIPPAEILFHRVFWSWLFYSGIQIARTRRLPALPRLRLAEFQRISHESVSRGKGLGFVLIWAGIAWVLWSSLRKARAPAVASV